MKKILLLSILLSFVSYGQISISAKHNKRELVFYILLEEDTSVCLGTDALKAYDFRCHANLISIDKNTILSSDSLLEINLCPKLNKNCDLEIPANTTLKCKIAKKQKVHFSESQKVFVQLTINNEVLEVESNYTDGKFCNKRVPKTVNKSIVVLPGSGGKVL